MRSASLLICLALASAPVLSALSALPRAVGGERQQVEGLASERPRVEGYDVMEKTITELQDAMAAGTVSSRRLVEIFLARIAAYDKQGPALNAIVATNPEARAIADARDAERKAGKVRGPLHGIPVLVKDNYQTADMPTSAGSIALASFHPKADAFMVKKLRDAGAVILGKTNMHELAAGIFNVGTRFGQTRNPYDLDRNPGGSSGGTGAAIAANFAVAGMGSDTCGSIRNPASHNNLVGLRGTRGLSSRTGIVPLSSTQDIGGPLARTMTDLAIMLDATVGGDPADAITKESAGHIPKSYRELLRADALKGARIGVVRTLFGTVPEDGEVTRIVNQALDALKKAGAEITDVVIPGLDDLLGSSSVINAEFKFDLADYLAGHPDAPVKSLGEILDRGLYHQALETNFRTRNAPEKRETDAYRRALIRREALRHAVTSVFEEQRLAAIVYPTLRRKPARIGDGQGGSTCQVSAHSGLPALGVPAGFTDDGLPIGIDLLGPAWSEASLLSLGFSIEQTLKLRRAPFSTPALVNGKAPAPTGYETRFEDPSGSLATVSVTYDPSTSRLTYVVSPTNPRGADLFGIWIHRVGAPGDKPGAGLHQIYGGAQPTSGVVVLSFSDRADLAAGRLQLRFFTRQNPAGSAGVPLRFR